jgi:DbpA-like RNA binding protein
LTIEARVRHVVLVTPPAVERAGKAWELMDPHAVIICADAEEALRWADVPPPGRAHAVTGLSRTAALLKDGRVGILAGAPADLAALVARSALKLESIQTLVIAWPESFVDQLDSLLAEAPEARRVILSWNPPALEGFFERHARRPEIVGDLPLDDVGRPIGPVASARYAVVSGGRSRVSEILDAMRAVRPYVWTGGAIEAPAQMPDAVVAAALPTRDELRQLAALGPTAIPVRASQVPYLRSIATLTPLPLPSAGERAQDRATTLRAQIAARLAQGDVDPELAVLSPLFEEYEPALVAGALLAIGRQSSVISERAPEVPQPTGWSKLFVTVGKKDNASAKDLVGALIKEAGLQKGQIGKIDVRETFSLVDIAAPAIEQAVQRLSGVTIRGRRVTARPDRR